MVPTSINCLRSLSSLQKEAMVAKTVAVQPRTDSNPLKEKAEIKNVTEIKTHIILFDVVNKLLEKRAAASNPRKAAVQCPNNIKWLEINNAETIKQATIFARSLNWKERMSVQIAIPISIWDRTKLEINIFAMVKLCKSRSVIIHTIFPLIVLLEQIALYFIQPRY